MATSFEEYKAGQGLATSGILSENKAALKAAKVRLESAARWFLSSPTLWPWGRFSCLDAPLFVLIRLPTANFATLAPQTLDAPSYSLTPS